MFLSSPYLQASLLAVSEQATTIVAIISAVAALLLFAVIALLCIGSNKRYDAKRIAFAGVTVGLSFALSFAKAGITSALPEYSRFSL